MSGHSKWHNIQKDKGRMLMQNAVLLSLKSPVKSSLAVKEGGSSVIPQTIPVWPP